MRRLVEIEAFFIIIIKESHKVDEDLTNRTSLALGDGPKQAISIESTIDNKLF